VVRVIILWQTTGMATHNEQVMLQLEPHEHVVRAARLRLDDDRPISYELVSVPVALLPKTNGTSADFDIHQLAAANRIKLGPATERTSQVAADRLLAKHLGIAFGSAVNMFDRLILTDVGQPIEWRIAFVKA
jgi:DNA-binding GntR family transcriptional regulator